MKSRQLEKVLDPLPPRKIAPNPKTNPKPNPNPNGWQFSSGAIVWLPPNPKTNPDLDQNPNPNCEVIFLGGQLSGYPLKICRFSEFKIKLIILL